MKALISIIFFISLFICQTPKTDIDKSNNYIYYTSGEYSRGYDIVRINTDGSSKVKITNNNGKNHYPHHNGPKLSPDKTKITYHSDTDGHDKYAIWVMNVDGSNKKRLTQKEGLFASWSHDSKNIVFSGRRNGVWEIFMIPSTGGVERNMSKNFKKDVKPSWGAHCTFHPNGKSIAYTYVRDNALYIMDLNTGQTTQIGNLNHRHATPVFSKDGTRLAVSRKMNEGYDLVTMKPDGTDIKVLANNVLSYSTPSWSNSDDELLFGGIVKGVHQLFKVNVNTKKETMITSGPGFKAGSTW